MSVNVPTHFSEEYTSLIQLKLQQMGSRLAGAVMNGTHVGKSAVAVEQVGSVSAQIRTTRHGDTPILDTPADKRWVFPIDYEWGDMVDKQDKVRMIVDPTGPYVQNGVNAMNRAKDDRIINAFFATATTGEDAGSTEAWTTDQRVAVTVGGGGNVGMNVAKLKDAVRLLMAAEVDMDTDPIFCAISAEQHDDLLQEIQAISLDYQTRPVLEEGRIRRFMGINFIHSERLLATADPYRRCPVWAMSGMHLGTWMEVTGQVYPRPDKSNNAQVLVEGTFGATRLELAKVVEIQCNEA